MTNPLKFAFIPLFALACVQVAASPAAAGDTTAPAVQAPLASATTAVAAPEQDDFRPATPAEIQQALRADPLTQSAFFNDQFNHNPTNVQLGLYLSNSLRAIGRNAEAADAAERALLVAPDNIDILIAAARARIAGDSAFYAIQPLQHAISLKGNDWRLYSLLGVAYDQVKRPDDAQGAWATALKMSPNNPAVLTNIAMAKVSSGDLAGAEPLLRTAVAQTGATLQIRQNLALVLGLEGKMPEAERLLRQDLPPDQADANLAWLQANLVNRGAAPATTDAPTRTWDAVKTSGG